MAALLLLLFSFILLLFLVTAIVIIPAFLFQLWLEGEGWPEEFPFPGMKAINTIVMFPGFIVALFISALVALSLIAIYEVRILPMF